MKLPNLTQERSSSLVDAALPDSGNQLIRLRWMAGAGVLAFTLAIGPLFHVTAPTASLLAVGVFILLYNLAFFLAERRLRQTTFQTYHDQNLVIMQIILDWIAVTLLIHFTGGIESPAIFFFLFHIVVVSIFFRPNLAYTFAVFAILLINGLTALEYFSILPHVPIAGYLEQPLYQNQLYVLAILIFFGSTAIFITYLVTNISERLRRRAGEVVELSESLQRATDRLQVLNESARSISSTLELSKVLNLLVKNTAEVMNVRACSLRLLDKSETRLEVAAVHGLSQAYLNKGPVLLENSPLDQKALSGATINIPDVKQSTLLQYPEWAAQEGYSSMLSAPLIGKSKPLGILRAYSEEKNHFSADDESFLMAIAAQGSIAIENAMAYQAIESLETTKSTFMRTFTHELRSPVGVIYSLLHNITDGYAGEVSPLQRDLIQRAIRRTDFLQELIDDLLDLSAGKMDVESTRVTVPCSVNEILERVIKRFEIPAQEKKINLQWVNKDEAKKTSVMATPEGLDRVFNNLISNAVKYTPSGGDVRIHLGTSKNEIAITVEDTGIGIPEEALPHLFTEFYRAPNAKVVENKGTGLGLAIVKDTVSLFGGTVSVDSKLGSGSRFTVTFPTVKET
jgi:signal transduction histidine kinase